MSESSEVRIVVETTVGDGVNQDEELSRMVELLRVATGEWGYDLPRVEATMSSYLKVDARGIPERMTRCRAEAVVVDI
jgi:hypothetical protein